VQFSVYGIFVVIMNKSFYLISLHCTAFCRYRHWEPSK